ncbi:Dyp-type peroxidase [Streptomyces wuyuanensis]|uniref:Dyp-type peroxidase n=1 Tax=Streptomyces wuyuanensis TaxID=1196353 RepID=UPI003D744BA5
MTSTTTTPGGPALELDDIQAGALMPRPNPYAGAFWGLRIDDRHAGRELLRRLIPLLKPASSFDPERPVSLGLSLTFTGLRALGVPQESLATFPAEFQQGMAARAAELGDAGENAPEHWDKPLGSADLHVVVAVLARDTVLMESLITLAGDALRDIPGVVPVWYLDVHVPADGREQFGFKDSISEPAIEGTGILGSNPHEASLKAGEFILGYEDETGAVAPLPQPDVLGRNGTYVAFRKLHQRVAAFRQYLQQSAADRAEQEWLAAKMVGRWPSGAPLAVAPDKDDPELATDPTRNNAFLYGDDPQGLKCPLGSHARRMNARDSRINGDVRLHRMIRRGTNYGPSLPSGVTEDDGADRGLMFAFVGAHLGRQFEFVQREWVNDGSFIGTDEKDPLVGANEEGRFTIPNRPIRRRLKALPSFVVNRGGEYCFAPGLQALRWLAELDT